MWERTTLKQAFLREYEFEISLHIAYRAKTLALKTICKDEKKSNMQSCGVMMPPSEIQIGVIQ